MSVKVMGHVWDSSLPPNLKLVLLAYADAAEHDGTAIFPGEQRLRDMTGYSRSQLYETTNALKEMGVLVQVKAGHRGQRAEHNINLDLLIEGPITGHSPIHKGSDSGGKVSGGPDPSRPNLPSPKREILPTVVSPTVDDDSNGRDPYYEAAATALDLPWDTSDSKALGSITAKARNGGHPPDEILKRAALHVATFNFPLTPWSLNKRWDQLGSKVTTATPAERKRVQTELERMRRREQIAGVS